jgi:MCP family monocarboxylic acid transporter-like MFS transporter 10
LTAFLYYISLQVRFGETLGVPSSQGALLVGYMSISQIFSKLLCGRLADMKRIKRLYILEISIFGFIICNMAVTAAKSFNALLVYVVIFGFFDGLFVVVIPILICDIVGRDLMATAIGGFYGAVAIPMMLGPHISGKYVPTDI